MYYVMPYFPTPPARPDDRNSQLSDRMRLAWSQHVYWTRMLIISIAERLKDLDAVTARLMRNPGDIGAVFAGYYPPETVRAIETLLTEHLQIGAALVTALRDGQKAQAETLDRQWYANADKMAAAFAGINPYYDEAALRDMLYRHLDLTKREAAARLAGDYPADIQAFDDVEAEALAMAGYFTNGILRQKGMM